MYHWRYRIMVLDFDKLKDEIVTLLEREQSITLATSVNGKVTARTMSHVNDGLLILFQTGGNSEKVNQIKANKNIAFAVANVQVEAVAGIYSHPLKDEIFCGKYRKKFPQYFDKYTGYPDEILVKASITKATLYKYIGGKPCRDILLISQNKAYREF